MRESALPRAARALLRLIPPRHREHAGGDLEEAHRARLANGSGSVAWVATVLDAGLVAGALAWVTLMEGTGARLKLAHEARSAVVGLWRSRGLSVLSVSVLAIGIGATAANLSLLQTVVLSSLPYEDADRLVTIWTWSELDGARDGSSYLNVSDWAASTPSLESVGLYYRPEFTQRTVTGVARPYRIQVGAVDGSFFAAVGARPILGRALTAGDGRLRAPVVVLSHAFWTRSFGASPDVLGQTIELDGRRRRIVGVMGQEVELPRAGTQLWEPHSLWTGFPDDLGNRQDDEFGVLARMSAEATLDGVQAELDAVSLRLSELYAEHNEGRRAVARPLREEVTGADLPHALWLLLAASLGLLVAACANVGQLWLSRGLARTRELTVRAALGASRRRLTALLLIEAGILSLIAAGLGLWLADACLGLVRALSPSDIPRIREVDLSLVVVGVAVGTSTGVALIVSWLPAAHLSRIQPGQALRSGVHGALSGSRHLSRTVFVVAQLTLATFLVVSGALLFRSLQTAVSADPGVETDGLAVARLSLPAESYPDLDAVWAFFDQAVRRVESVPGVSSAAAVEDFLHKRNTANEIHTRNEEQPFRGLRVISDGVTPGAVRTLGLRLVSGSALEARDRWGAGEDRPLLINERLAEGLWPGEEPIGRELMLGRYDPAKPWNRVVGVVETDRRRGLDEDPIGQVFFVLPFHDMDFLIRASLPLEQVAGPVRDAISSVDPDLAVADLIPARHLLDRTIRLRRAQAYLVAISALGTVALAMIGVFGILAESVVARRSEIGVRMAVGARTTKVVGLVLRDGLALAVGGVALGVLGALLGGSFLRAYLFGIEPWDWVALTLAVATILALSGIASAVPAWRAARVDPVRALGGGH